MKPSKKLAICWQHLVDYDAMSALTAFEGASLCIGQVYKYHMPTFTVIMISATIASWILVDSCGLRRSLSRGKISNDAAPQVVALFDNGEFERVRAAPRGFERASHHAAFKLGIGAERYMWALLHAACLVAEGRAAKGMSLLRGLLSGRKTGRELDTHLRLLRAIAVAALSRYS